MLAPRPTHDVTITPPEITPPDITPPSIAPVSIAPVTPHISIPTCTQTITPDENGYVPPGTCHALFHYYPSFGAAVAMSVLFGIVSFVHIYQAARYKKTFCWVVILGGLWELGAYASRAVATKNQQSTGVVLVSQILVLLAPLVVNAFDYMVLARLMHFYLPEKKLPWIRPELLALCFVLLDFASFVIQMTGGFIGAPGAPPEQQQRGLNIYKGGIGIQQFFIVIFLGITVIFHVAMSRAEKSRAYTISDFQIRRGWKKLTYALYASLLFISVRIIFRFVEFSGGVENDNPVVSHEIYLYMFDATPILLAVLVWNIVHPGHELVGPDAEPPKIELRRRLRLKKQQEVKKIEFGYDDAPKANVEGNFQLIEQPRYGP